MATTPDIMTFDKPSALQLPEILSLVFKWIVWDSWDFWNVNSDKEGLVAGREARGTLAKCVLVNRLWHDEAISLLWSAPSGYGGIKPKNLHSFLEKIDPARRQVFANHVKRAHLVTVNDTDGAKSCDAILSDVAFPNLRDVKMTLDDRAGLYIPRIKNHSVKRLDLDPRFEWYPETYGMSPKQTAHILDQIPDIFPDVEWVEFIDHAQVTPGTLDRFKERLPGMKTFDHSMVVEASENLNFRPEIRAEAARGLEAMQQAMVALGMPISDPFAWLMVGEEPPEDE